MKNHSLKYGMTIQNITPIQAEFIFSMAKQIGIERGGTGAVLENLWYTGECVSYCVNSKLCSEQHYVTFERFITAMVTLESVETVSPEVESLFEILQAENEALKKRIAELEPKVDNRVDFGSSVTFDAKASGKEAFIAIGTAKDGDTSKVIIATYGYQWELIPNYLGNQNAVQLIKTNH